jgi:hypothetical protein
VATAQSGCSVGRFDRRPGARGGCVMPAYEYLRNSGKACCTFTAAAWWSPWPVTRAALRS